MLTKLFIGVFIFCLTLFIYVHTQFHLKTSNEKDVYEVDRPSKEQLEDMCNNKQPFLTFTSSHHIQTLIDLCNKSNLLDKYSMFDVKIRDTKDMNLKENELFLPLSINLASRLFTADSNKTYMTESNQDFLHESGVNNIITSNDNFFRPALLSNSSYDIIFGSHNSVTPFRYDLNYRNFYIVTQGSIKVKLAPPISNKFLKPIYDYENFEFRTSICPWTNMQSIDYEKSNVLELNLVQGNILFIPSYWWYSFQNTTNSCILSLKYRTYMSNISILPQICMHMLQQHNIKRKIARRIDLSLLNGDTNKSKDTVEDDTVKEDTAEKDTVKEDMLKNKEVIFITSSSDVNETHPIRLKVEEHDSHEI
jgi:hypothetical protein